MSKAKVIIPIAGSRPIAQTYPTDTTLDEALGSILPFAEPYYGGGEVIFVYFSATTAAKALVSITPTFTNGAWRVEAGPVANTANLAQSVGVAVMPAAAGNYGWVQIAGMTPVACNANVAANTSFGIVAAGQGGAVAAGKQILGGRVHGASTTTVAKTAMGAQMGYGATGGFNFQVTNTDGWFVGGYVAGTGVGAAAIITAISTDEQLVTVSVANTAAVTGTITMTPNNGTIFYNTVYINRPFAQGAIT
jgi:hypothetical protein